MPQTPHSKPPCLSQRSTEGTLIFSKKKVDTLTLHQPYDLKINLVDGASPLPGMVYYLSQSELHELCEFLDKHLWIGFICPSHSPHGAPVLFIEKKNGDLCL